MSEPLRIVDDPEAGEDLRALLEAAEPPQALGTADRDELRRRLRDVPLRGRQVVDPDEAERVIEGRWLWAAVALAAAALLAIGLLSGRDDDAMQADLESVDEESSQRPGPAPALPGAAPSPRELRPDPVSLPEEVREPAPPEPSQGPDEASSPAEEGPREETQLQETPRPSRREREPERPQGTPPARGEVEEAAAEEAPTEEAQPTPAQDEPTEEDHLTTESDLVTEARRQLTASPARALEILDEHARRFRGGQLAGERELLALEALRRLGRSEARRERARAFLRTFPVSPHRALVEEIAAGRR